MSPRLGILKRVAPPAVLVAAAAAGCVGSIGDPDGAGSGDPSLGPNGGNIDAPTKFVCDPKQKPAIAPMRSRTTAQYRNALQDLAAWALGDPAGGSAVIAEVGSALASLPDNVPAIPQNDPAAATAYPDGGWLRADQDQQLLRVKAYYDIGGAVGAALTSPSRLGVVVGNCAVDGNGSNDANCLAQFIQKFGERALGRPLSSQEVDFYKGVYGADPKADPAAYADVIAVFLNAPEVLYAVEHGDAKVDGMDGVYSLSAHELASRLAYQIWDTRPDDELLALADDGTLLDPEVYRKQVDRLFADPRGRAAVRRFFEGYIQVADKGGPRGTGGLNHHDLTAPSADPAFQAFAGADMPSPELASRMADEALDMLEYYTWTEKGGVHELLQSPLSFAKTPDLAKIYGLPTWDGTSEPPSFPEGQRPGLFTRALFVAAGADTSPILKGVFLRRYVLCDLLGRPPAAAANAHLTQSTTQSTRQATESLTSVAPCNSCHPAWINPLGFATEDFDALGRYRTEQTLFNPDGTVSAKVPVDTSVTPHVSMTDETTTTENAADLMTLIEESDKPAACLSRAYFRYTFARFEDIQTDACTLEAVRGKLADGGNLADMLRAIVETPAFTQKTFE